MTNAAPPRPEGLPFLLPDRPPVTRVRLRDARDLLAPGRPRTQPLAGYDDRYADIVDYIVRITEEIWADRAIGRIYETYDHACTVYTHYGVTRSVEEVVASTVATLNGFPDGEAHHLAVAWDGDEAAGFHTSHLGFSRSTNVGRSAYGPGTGRRVGLRFVADCVSRENRIHTEWLVRDNGALVRQLGLDVDVVARETAAATPRERFVISPDTPLQGQAPRGAWKGATDTLEGAIGRRFHDLWNLKRLDRLAEHYAPDAVAHGGGGRVAQGVRNIGAQMLAVMASIPDGVMRVDRVCFADETDGVIVAARWVLEGTTRRGGVLGDAVPEGRPVAMMGMTHMRFTGPRVAEEWTVFDEVGVLAQAYAA